MKFEYLKILKSLKMAKTYFLSIKDSFLIHYIFLPIAFIGKKSVMWWVLYYYVALKLNP